MRRMFAATIGFFDGVHKGHLCLIDQLRQRAKECQLQSMLITFDRHPRQVLHADYVPGLLSTLTEKVDLLRKTGVDEVCVLHFTPEMARMDALQFMRKVLAKDLDVAMLLIGYDHQFGCGGGTFEQYCEWGRESDIQVMLADRLLGEKVSSSAVRRKLLAGNVSEANKLLGYPYRLIGTVVGGHRMGHQLGFPTANLLLPAEKLLPGCGVYAVRVLLPHGEQRGGMLNIGSRPTMHNGNDVTVEVNIFDFHGNLYDKKISVELIGHLRSECTFSSVEELREQLILDESDARKMLETCDEQ